MKPHRPKTVTVQARVCACGCGQTFLPKPRAPHQRFLNVNHRVREWRDKQREQARG